MTPVQQWLPRLQKLGQFTTWSRPMQLGIAAGVIAVLVVAALWLRDPGYKTLFSSLEDRDGGAIIAALTQMNVPYRLSENGQSVLVPEDRVHETRMQLAQQGLPRSGTVGFELLDQARFGASQFAEQVNYQRALEGELANSIKAMHAIQDARVHLALPRDSLFVRDRQPPTASVLVTLYPGRQLSQAQVTAISWLVASSVPHLGHEGVSVVDQTGRLLSLIEGEQGQISSHRDMVHDVEQRTVNRILTLLTPLLGEGNVRAQVSADMDFSVREQTSEVYRPNQTPGQGAVRSEQTSDSVQNGELLPQGVPGALTNQPPVNPVAPVQQDPGQAQGNDPGAAATPGLASNSVNGSARSEKTVNYEVDRTISHVKQAAGRLQRLSVAVVVNHRLVEDAYQPLSTDELARLEQLVRQAMGFSSDRGDTVSIVNSAFAVEPTVPFWRDPTYVGYLSEMVKYLVIGFTLYLLWRLILKRIVLEMHAAQKRRDEQMKHEIETRKQADVAARQAAEINQYEENLKRARELAGKDPRAVAMVLRAWMEKKDDSSPTI